MKLGHVYFGVHLFKSSPSLRQYIRVTSFPKSMERGGTRRRESIRPPRCVRGAERCSLMTAFETDSLKIRFLSRIRLS